ncbi:MAG: hypothetical protein NZ750_02815 [Anaerolineae bacterium]|nr:hypothetical protein [Anaerolineae bacterium]MDW8173389.1 hypothetical protein [Anaerolineae bacterium]
MKTLQRTLQPALSLLIGALVLTSAVAQEGDFLMDIGFRPTEHGFSFPNYGNDSVSANLTSVEMVRLFGEKVCSGPLDSEGGCRLRPTAQLWMEEISEAMDGGHCEGMAVLALLFYGEYISPADFGGELASDLSLEDELLQREIALWWATQATSPVTDNMIRDLPSKMVQMLIDSMEEEFYTVGIYLPDGSGGHAITPYAVVDMGDGLYHIMVYDNNYPGEERFIEVNVEEDTWVYTGSTNPEEAEEEYFGDAGTRTLELTPMLPRLDRQRCEFCGTATYGGSDDSNDEGEGMEISFNGSIALRITDNKGNNFVIDPAKSGFPQLPKGYRLVRGKSQFGGNSMADNTIIQITDPAVTSIGVSGNHPMDSANAPKLLADERGQTANPANAGKEATSVKITRRGAVTTISGLRLGEKPINFTIERNKVSYEGVDSEETELRFRQAVSAGSGKDFLYDFSGATGRFELELDGETGGVRVAADEDGSTFSLRVDRYDEDGNVVSYERDEFELDGSGFARLDAADWGDTLDILIVDADGNIITSFSYDNAFDDDDVNGTDVGVGEDGSADDDNANDGGADDGDSGGGG